MRLPHRATVLRPSTVTDAYGDTSDTGPLAVVGSPFPAWVQVRSSLATVGDTAPVVTATRLFYSDALVLIEEGDTVEANGKRYTVEGDPYLPVNPRGRTRFWQADLKRVTRGG